MSWRVLKKLKKMADVLIQTRINFGVKKWLKRPVNGELSCRLDRMERRMSLLKQKEDFSDVQNKSFGSPNSCQNSATKTSQEQVTGTADRGTKRKSTGLEPQNLNKRFAVEAHKTLSTSTPRHDRHRADRHQRYRNRSDVVSSTVSSTQRVVEPASPSADNKRKIRKCMRDSPDNTVLRTSDPYYVSYYEPPPPDDVDIESRGDIIQGDDHVLPQVELPQWEYKKYTNLWVLEGTENLEDEIFVKRHQKPEIEEKRRKRWDLQRIREQKIYEKLKDKERGEASTAKDEPNQPSLQSFYPTLDSITHIEVTNKIPVMVFGHPVPTLEKTEFSLPWELATSTRAHSSRSSRNSRHT